MIIIMSRARKYACRICLWLKLFFRAPQCEPSLREKWLYRTKNIHFHGLGMYQHQITQFTVGLVLASTAKTKTTTVRARFTNLSKETKQNTVYGHFWCRLFYLFCLTGRQVTNVSNLSTFRLRLLLSEPLQTWRNLHIVAIFEGRKLLQVSNQIWLTLQ